jgi:hypothetical protein
MPAPSEAPVPAPTDEWALTPCMLPAFLNRFSLITEEDDNLAPNIVYRSIAMGVTLSDCTLQTNIVVGSNFANPGY